MHDSLIAGGRPNVRPPLPPGHCMLSGPSPSLAERSRREGEVHDHLGRGRSSTPPRANVHPSAPRLQRCTFGRPWRVNVHRLGRNARRCTFARDRRASYTPRGAPPRDRAAPTARPRDPNGRGSEHGRGGFRTCDLSLVKRGGSKPSGARKCPADIGICDRQRSASVSLIVAVYGRCPAILAVGKGSNANSTGLSATSRTARRCSRGCHPGWPSASPSWLCWAPRPLRWPAAGRFRPLPPPARRPC
jgi:hypothetical protein